MKLNLFATTALVESLAACQSVQTGISLEHQADSLTVLRISHPKKYLLLPIQESAAEGKVRLDTGSPADVAMDVRLATDSIDYYVPFELPEGEAQAKVSIERVHKGAVCWDSLSVCDVFDSTNTDYFRPVYHHTPVYGWMNDANGLVYKDGEYHLYFQYNPYGSKWGNMHWGHSVSRDLVHWQHLEPAIARDTMGHIFSGSTVVDKDNTAGYGKNAIIAFYTSASDEHGQIQCMAYSTDNGRTFTKYEHNPILTPFDGLKDFRDPKVFWYEPTKQWIMIVSADKNMRFYSSTNLKDWQYLSQFGEGYGAQPNQFECPDFVQLPVDGDKSRMKWVMIVNINPGCLFGGSATEYFVGDFDGKTFRCDDAPSVTKWLDYGKDHYATVCFSNTGSRVVAVPWMSNWQYANATPNRQYRGANALPRELSLFSKDGSVYMAANAVKETAKLRRDTKSLGSFTVSGERLIRPLPTGEGGACELTLSLTPGQATRTGFELLNDRGEKVDIYFDLTRQRLVMDRTQSGLVHLDRHGEMNVHEKETDEHRKRLSVNYVNDFALGTWAPLSLCEGKTYQVQVFVDKTSVEIFVDGGRIAMTNLVFPTTPYNALRFYSQGGESSVGQLTVHRLGL